MSETTTDDRAEGPGTETLAVPLAALRPSLEAVLMVADQPLETMALASAVGYPVEEVTDALHALAAEYADQGRGFDLRNVGGGWRFYTREEYAAVVEGFVLDGQQARLTQAALETLAVVAYKQPVSRARVSAIRGVNVDGVMRTLLTRGLVEEAGQDHETGANLYRTTGYFLERIGVTSLDELPEIAPYLPDMDDLEDELAEIAAQPAALEATLDGAGDPGPEESPRPEPPVQPEPAPRPEQGQPAPHHASPHSGDGTEPDGGTEPT
jgi:segregation and condensation protein B